MPPTTISSSVSGASRETSSTTDAKYVTTVRWPISARNGSMASVVVESSSATLAPGLTRSAAAAAISRLASGIWASRKPSELS